MADLSKHFLLAAIVSETEAIRAEIEGMVSENALRERTGASPAFGYEAFLSVRDRALANVKAAKEAANG